MTRDQIEKRMDELARKYVETDDWEIIEELNRLSRQLQELEKHFAVRTYAKQGGLRNCPFPFFSVTKGSRHRGLGVKGGCY